MTSEISKFWSKMTKMIKWARFGKFQNKILATCKVVYTDYLFVYLLYLIELPRMKQLLRKLILIHHVNLGKVYGLCFEQETEMNFHNV